MSTDEGPDAEPTDAASQTSLRSPSARRPPTHGERLAHAVGLVGLTSVLGVIFGWGMALDALGVVVVAAVLGAQLKMMENETLAQAVMIAVAAFGAQWVSGYFWAPWNLYNGWESQGLWPEPWMLAVGIYAQANLLKPLSPTLDGTKARSWLAALLPTVLVPVWVLIYRSVGPASASLAVAGLVLVVIWTTAGRHLTVYILLLAALLAASGIAEHGKPTGRSLFATAFDFGIDAAPALTTIDSASVYKPPFAADVDVQANSPDLFGCPKNVVVSVWFYTTPVHVGRGVKSRLLPAALAASSYVFSVTGSTRLGFRFENPGVTVEREAARTYEPAITTYSGSAASTGKYAGPTGFNFTAPWESQKGTGSCYVRIPEFTHLVRPNAWPLEASELYSARVEVSPGGGSDLTGESYSPRLTADPLNQLDRGVTCSSDPTVASACPAVFVVTAHWAAAYSEITLLVVGALLAIAAERFFRRYE